MPFYEEDEFVSPFDEEDPVSLKRSNMMNLASTKISSRGSPRPFVEVRVEMAPTPLSDRGGSINPPSMKQSMPVGLTKHTNEVASAAAKLRSEGYRVIDVDGKMPTHMATLGDRIFGIAPRHTKTYAAVRRQWPHYDGVFVYNNEAKSIDDECYDLELLGLRIIPTKKKIPDLLAYREDEGWCAVELIGGPETHRLQHQIKEKTKQYSMWDRVIVRRFTRGPGQ